MAADTPFSQPHKLSLMTNEFRLLVIIVALSLSQPLFDNQRSWWVSMVKFSFNDQGSLLMVKFLSRKWDSPLMVKFSSKNRGSSLTVKFSSKKRGSPLMVKFSSRNEACSILIQRVSDDKPQRREKVSRGRHVQGVERRRYLISSEDKRTWLRLRNTGED